MFSGYLKMCPLGMFEEKKNEKSLGKKSWLGQTVFAQQNG